jgi:hypothetical protein
MRSRLRLTVLNETGTPLSVDFLQSILQNDPEAKMKKNWGAILEELTKKACTATDVIIVVCNDCQATIQQLKSLWKLRIYFNFSPRPICFFISRSRQSVLTRYRIERLGGYFLQLCDVPGYFQREFERIHIFWGVVNRALPLWRIVYEGNGKTLRAEVFSLNRGHVSQVPGSERQIATLAVFLKNNGITRSFSGWRKCLIDDPLFKPSGGSFSVPSVGTIKMWFKRDFVKNLQIAFDTYRSGFDATRVIERIYPASHRTKCRIRGEWDTSRK